MATAKKTKKAKTGKSAAKKTAPKRPLRTAKSKRPVERVRVIKLGDKSATVIGKEVVVGQTAPEFTARANDWSPVRGLADTTGKVRIFAAVPSLSTSVCDKETRTFNERAAELGDEVRVWVISTDLPPTQKHWCGHARVDRVQTVSDHMDTDFGIKYGTLIKERRWHRRAVFVVDRDNKVTYAAYMPALGMEPNYDEVLAAAKAAL
ncbi:MAG: thiol peroxidase [Chloroflexi bacterium]|nr:thiol peroxidase [Chloroflexota bacterium]